MPEKLDEIAVENYLNRIAIATARVVPFQRVGKVTSILGSVVGATLPNANVGTVCEIKSRNGIKLVTGMIVAISGSTVKLCIAGNPADISINDEVIIVGPHYSKRISSAMLGRVIDPFGNAIDDGAAIDVGQSQTRIVNQSENISPLKRRLISERFATGVKAIDATMSMGKGQRIGVFGPPGTGKSVLLGMLSRGCSADIVVLALIGERGREVREFLDRELPAETRKRCVTIVSISDSPPLERLWGAQFGVAIAEHFRAEGKNVVLMMDSLTRFARARREVALQSGEMPVRQGFPPSVFDELPKLIERTGNSEVGSITAFFTILQDGDPRNDVLSEEIKSLLDGHIILSKDLASEGHYPAIDVLESKSRLMNVIAKKEHQEASLELKKLLVKYEEIKLLVQVGEYKAGSDPTGDKALAKIADLRKFLQQNSQELEPYNDTIKKLIGVINHAN